VRRYAIISVILIMMCSIGCRTFASNERLSESDIMKIINAPLHYTYLACGSTLIFWQGKRYSIAIRQYNKKPDYRRIEYKSYPLDGVVVCCDNQLMWRHDPLLKKQVYTESTGCMSIEKKRKLFINNYIAYDYGKTKIAGRNARIIEIKDKSNQLKKRLLVDSITFVTLQTDEYDSSSRIISSTSFKSIDYNVRIPDSLFRRPSANMDKTCERMFTRINSLSELSHKAGFKVIIPRYLPKGFNLDGYRLYDCSCRCGYKSAYIRYSNGMSGISIFESMEISDCSKLCGEGMHIAASRANVSVNGINVYIIADLKLNAIKKIADSCK